MPVDRDGSWMCWRRTRQCSKCEFRYTADDYDLWECPECGNDRHCRRKVKFDGGACKFHGGKSLKGAESPSYVHGKYSIYMPNNLLERYEGFLEDPRRLSLDKEMAVTRALISDRIQQLESMNTAEAWSKLKKLYTQLMNARLERKEAREQRILGEIGDVINHGTGAASTRAETIKLIDLERKLVNTQRQLYVDAGEFIIRGTAITIFMHIIEAVKENVIPLPGGAQAATAISRAIGRLLGTLGERGTGSGSSESPIDH